MIRRTLGRPVHCWVQQIVLQCNTMEFQKWTKYPVPSLPDISLGTLSEIPWKWMHLFFHFSWIKPLILHWPCTFSVAAQNSEPWLEACRKLLWIHLCSSGGYREGHQSLNQDCITSVLCKPWETIITLAIVIIIILLVFYFKHLLLLMQKEFFVVGGCALNYMKFRSIPGGVH